MSEDTKKVAPAATPAVAPEAPKVTTEKRGDREYTVTETVTGARLETVVSVEVRSDVIVGGRA